MIETDFDRSLFNEANSILGESSASTAFGSKSSSSPADANPKPFTTNGYLEPENSKDRDRQKEKKKLRNQVKQHQKMIRKSLKTLPHFCQLVSQQSILIET